MKLSLSRQKLIEYLNLQMESFFPDGNPMTERLGSVMPAVMERLDHCFSHIGKKYYFEDNETVFNHLNSDHYAMFLYFVANQAWRQNYIPLAEKAFLLNKALHGLDAFYSINLPDIFLLVHPLGTVLGNARYADFLVVYQNVTVGSDVAGEYPVFGESNVLYSKSSVIGRCILGNNVSLAAHAFLRNRQVPENTIVVGLYPENTMKNNARSNRQDFFPGLV